jgi:hypothetical protein
MANNNKPSSKSSMIAETGRGLAFFGMVSGIFIGILLFIAGLYTLSQGKQPEATASVKSVSPDGREITVVIPYQPRDVEVDLVVDEPVGTSVTVHWPKGKPYEAKFGPAPEPGTTAGILVVLGLVIAAGSYGVYELTKRSNTIASGYAAMSAFSAFSK